MNKRIIRIPLYGIILVLLGCGFILGTLLSQVWGWLGIVMALVGFVMIVLGWER